MLKCNCNELCFYYKNTSITEIDGKKYTQTHNFNKCNRLLSDNSKKKPCDFYSKILIDEKVVHVENVQEKIKIDCPIVNEEKNNDKILTHRDIRNKIYDMLEYYYIKSSNYFGNLNYNLKLIGYHVHDPMIESLTELKKRLSQKPSNITKIYTNEESYFSHTIGEFDYDYENEEQIFKRIKRGYDPLKWTKNEIVQDILKRKVFIHKKLSKSSKSTKTNKSIKSTDCYKVTLIKELFKNNNEDDEEEEKDEEDDDKDDKEGNEDDDDEEDEKNSQNLKDNEFDVEEFSDDDNDYDDNNYEDFSD